MNLEKLIRLIALIRPRFYNHITWSVVISGLTLMTTPLWLEIVNLILSYLGKGSLRIETEFRWGFALVLLGLMYHMVNSGLLEYSRSRTESVGESTRVVHDRKVFECADKLISESQFEDFVEDLLSDHSFQMEASRRLDKLLNYLKRKENTFLDGDLVNLVGNLGSSWNELGELLGARFFIWPEHQTGPNCRLCMQPNWNIDRGGGGDLEESRRYGALSSELRLKAKRLQTAYRALRMEIKRKLLV